MTIRLAVPGDALALLEIYRQYIQTPITFEYELPTLEEFTRRISDALKQYPYLVLEDQGRLLGYTYAHPEREWKAYQWNAELSIYLAPAAVGKGYGRAAVPSSAGPFVPSGRPYRIRGCDLSEPGQRGPPKIPGLPADWRT